MIQTQDQQGRIYDLVESDEVHDEDRDWSHWLHLADEYEAKFLRFHNVSCCPHHWIPPRAMWAMWIRSIKANLPAPTGSIHGPPPSPCEVPGCDPMKRWLENR